LIDALKTEWNGRNLKTTEGRMRLARFPWIKTVEAFDFSFQPSIDRKALQFWAEGLSAGRMDRLRVVPSAEECPFSLPTHWLQEPQVETVRQMLGTQTSMGKSLLRSLITTEDFQVEGSVRSMVDKGFYLVHSLFQALLEARFAHTEGQEALAVALEHTIIRWVSSEPLEAADYALLNQVRVQRLVKSEHERMDLLLCLATIASQSGLVGPVVLGYGELEEALYAHCRPALRQLCDVLGDVDRWSKLGSPVGVVVGFRNGRRDLPSLRRLNPKLAERIEAGLSWAK
jgi:hypothetical protein